MLVVISPFPLLWQNWGVEISLLTGELRFGKEQIGGIQ